ncbi:MAG TPA: GDSL-type esterase/lipase family protein [Myxococcota bacterium]|nr:GDSL-type esterase/lipase family protein [Myxococcota bacterium]
MRALQNGLLLLAALAIALLVGEVGLRVAGFSFAPTLDSVEFGWPNIEVRRARYASDPDLFWVPRDYAERLGSFEGARPDLVFLGDSCTEWGRWPRLLLASLDRDRAGEPLRAAVLGTAGWSSHQGLAQLRRDVVPLRPRALTLWFGWNDHWRGMGVDDASVSEISRQRPAWLAGLRWEQLWLKTRLAWRAHQAGVSPERVPPDAFRRNLEEMVRLARGADGVPALVTAPTSHRPGAEPPQLSPRWIEDLSRLVPLHRQYVEIVREVAARENAVLCDLAARFDGLSDDERDRSFAADGIHFTLAGDRRAAAWLRECFEQSAALRQALSLARSGLALAR